MTSRMTNSCERNDPASDVKYYPTSRRAPSRHSLYHNPYVAHRESLAYMLPRNQCSNALFDMLLESSPEASGKLLWSDHQSRRLLLGVCVATRQSIPKLYAYSSRQMTTSHQVPKWSHLDQPSQVLEVFHSRVAIALLFFDPGCDGVTTHAEGATEPPQRARFFISSQYQLALLGSVGIARRVLTTLASTISTQVFLFAIRREAIAYDVVALAVTTLQFDSNHSRDSLTHHSMLSHYQILYCLSSSRDYRAELSSKEQERNAIYSPPSLAACKKACRHV
jgi:hypothetical protein